MGEFNPYAPSKASLAARTPAPAVSSGDGVWRDGKTVVTLPDANLPARCVKCNAAADQPTRGRMLYWVHPALYLLFFAGALILIIVYMVVRKKADVDPGLCAEHKKRRLLGLTLGWLGSFGGFALLVGGIASDSGSLALAGLLMIIGAIVIGMAWGRLIWARKITKEEVRLGGFCADYLDDLPQYPGGKQAR